MLEVRDLKAAYGQHRALNGVSLSVKPGEIVVILGANGAGKSTLLKAVAGICEGQVSGAVQMRGEGLLGLPAHKVVEQGIALVPEGRGVFGDLSVRENLTLGANPRRARDETEATLERILRLFPKLESRATQTVRTMSGGEQQMVAIGRAMMSNPEILMLDEPSLGLSPLLSKELFASLSSVRDAGLGILLVEQNARLSLKIADRGYLLENGAILREAAAAVLRDDPAVQAAYLGAGSAKAAPVAAPSAPVPVTVRAKPLRSISASEIAGLDIGALVRDAAQKGAHVPAATVKPMTPAQATAARPAAMQAALDSIEAAARRARGAPSAALPPLRATARPAAPTPTAPAAMTPADPAPMPTPGGRVEVWRKRPGTTTFDRTEV
jgi:branched-chain amino acid transport system ATP-binding protein